MRSISCLFREKKDRTLNQFSLYMYTFYGGSPRSLLKYYESSRVIKMSNKNFKSPIRIAHSKHFLQQAPNIYKYIKLIDIRQR